MPPTGFTPNNVWAQSTPTGVSEELTLPSGQTCMAHKIGVEGLLEAGILDHADQLTSLVQTEHIEKARGTAKLVKKATGVMADLPALKAIITVADKALPIILDSPVVRLHYVASGTSTRTLTDSERNDIRKDNPGVIFTDQIGLEDKMFLFDWAIGNLAAMRAFRNGTPDDVAGVANVPGVSRATKRSARRTR